MDTYTHKVQYYETDKMGCVHHSNYIRWMEEARVELLDRLGIGFSMMETRGIISPVVGIQCRLRRAGKRPGHSHGVQGCPPEDRL